MTVYKELVIRSTGGSIMINKIGTLKNYGKAWLYKDGVVNTLSLSKVKKKHRIIYDS